MKPATAAIVLGVLVGSVGAALADVPKFGSTCIPVTRGTATNLCVASNGKTLSSTYKFRGTIDTRGTHTGCRASADKISCTGGSYKTTNGSGPQSPFTVKLSGGKPASASW